MTPTIGAKATDLTMLRSLDHARTALDRQDRQIRAATHEAEIADRAARKAWDEVDILRASAEALREQIKFDEGVLASLNKKNGIADIDVEAVVNAVVADTGCPRPLVESAVQAHAALVKAGYDPEMTTAQEAALNAALVAGAIGSTAWIITGGIERAFRSMSTKVLPA